MSVTIVVRADVDQPIREEETAIFTAGGLTLSPGFRAMLLHTEAGRQVPFDTFDPNEETIAAMMEACEGKPASFESIEAHIADLHSDDQANRWSA